MMTRIPDNFREQMVNVYGSRVEEWVRSLPDLISKCEAQFGIRVEEPFENLSYNYIAHGINGEGRPIVLKLSFEKDELVKEIRTLTLFAGRGAVQVIEWNDTLGAAVLERVLPGTPLSATLDDREATEVFCEVFRRLRHSIVAEEGDFHTLRGWFGALVRYRDRFGTEGPLPEHWVVRAEETLEELLRTTTETVLIHGDLHHGNILRHGDGGWAVIDPKGMIGDVHFETIQYLLNYVDRDGDCDTVLCRRVAMISERLSLDRSRIARWGIARGVLEACWSIEGGADWKKGIDISERFARLLDAE
ncbi:aminoglycoside phosphotransferase family protein [Paenibacillus xylaniclasticus]|uniref:aminoglycoside phosphotransferase family protein n=1 Tax=Paenibacillus xylaniclasticus TaxID=588083 RepID=UPI000FD7502B|nr:MULTISPECIES: aminoglycoside phosphotransferase family protein [Paenibacillus]GFN31968.1 streptomycin 3''-phosphotransferase [Paenibacillus curdlanolyticus]